MGKIACDDSIKVPTNNSIKYPPSNPNPHNPNPHPIPISTHHDSLTSRHQSPADSRSDPFTNLRKRARLSRNIQSSIHTQIHGHRRHCSAKDRPNRRRTSNIHPSCARALNLRTRTSCISATTTVQAYSAAASASSGTFIAATPDQPARPRPTSSGSHPVCLYRGYPKGRVLTADRAGCLMPAGPMVISDRRVGIW